MIERSRYLGAVAAVLGVALCAPPLVAGDETRPVRYDAQTMSSPRLIHKVAPVYPQEAKEEGVEGIVVLDAVIAKDGSVRETRVQQGEDARLADAAQAAVGQWRYEPVLDENGEPMELLFTVTIRFKLGDK
jgi:TonB family protein